jgi:hypothetical protein
VTVLVLNAEDQRLFARLADSADWASFVAFVDRNYLQEIDNLLRASSNVHQMQGYCNALRDITQAARSAKPSLGLISPQ